MWGGRAAFACVELLRIDRFCSYRLAGQYPGRDPAAGPFSPAAVRSRRSRSMAGASCRGRATTSISSRRWAWRCLPPKRRMTEEMFIVGAQALAEQVTEENLSIGLIYPPQGHILKGSLHVAERIRTSIFNQGLARVPRPDDIGALIRARVYRPVYPE